MREGFKNIAYRLVKAEEAFIETAMGISNISAADATKVLNFYRKNKLVKLDMANMRYTVKHGAYWEADVLRRAVSA